MCTSVTLNKCLYAQLPLLVCNTGVVHKMLFKFTMALLVLEFVSHGLEVWDDKVKLV